MAHMITKKDSLFYTGEKPWHGIGKEVGDVLTASEALIAAGLTWQVEESPLYDSDGKELKDFKAIRRADTREVFQVAGKGYHIVQNADAFKMFDEITGTGMAKYEVAGSLKGGKIVWMLAKLPYDFSLLKGKDEVKSYMTLTMAHDGSWAIQAYETGIRTVCWNTLRASMNARENVVYGRHTKNVKKNFVQRAQVTLDRARQYFLDFKAASEALAAKQMTTMAIDSFLNKLFETEAMEKVSTRTQNIIDDIKTLHQTGKGTDIPGVQGTAWGVWNAVTEHIDHVRSTRGEADGRLASSWLGSGAQLRQKAFDLLVA